MRYQSSLILDKQNKKIDLQAPYWVVVLWKQQTSSATFELTKKLNVKSHQKILDFKLLHPQKISFDKDFWHIAFLRKEKVYTKLKYSRTQSYDIVSAGVAALFAGFLGFLICEKFGFELLDSGDFLFLYLYIVLLFFTLRTLVSLWTKNLRESTLLIFLSIDSWCRWVCSIFYRK